ncbi:DGKA [Symbiodinium sp. CCMP2592]|nr:DGKA [Symbiodinium sp. CCMP2592]
MAYNKAYSLTLYWLSSCASDHRWSADGFRSAGRCYHRTLPGEGCFFHEACEETSGLCCPDPWGVYPPCCSKGMPPLQLTLLADNESRAGENHEEDVEQENKSLLARLHEDERVIWLLVGLLLLLLLRMVMSCSQPKDIVVTEYAGEDDYAGIATTRRCAQPERESTTRALMNSGRYIIAFVNKGSGDQKSALLHDAFSSLLGQHGCVCVLPDDLERGMSLAAGKQKTDQNVYVLACGGDGTVTWVLPPGQQSESSADGIIPMGTGNDLARSLGWGPALSELSQLESYVMRTIHAEIVLLDQWKLTLRPQSMLPPSLRPKEEHRSEYVGYFTNYFSVGMDARTTYEVGKARQGRLGRACFQLRCLWPFSFIHGGFLCYACKAPNVLRVCCCRKKALNKDLSLWFDGSEEAYSFRGRDEFRQFTLTNINSYGAGMALYGKQRFRHAVSPTDWRLEAFTLHGPVSVIGMTTAKKFLGLPCQSCSIRIDHQPARVDLELTRGQYFQMDGEPWYLSAACTATIEPNTQVKMLCPPLNGPGAGVWGSRQERSFWKATQTTSRTTELHDPNLEMAVLLEVLAFRVRFKNCKLATVYCKGRTPK